MDEQGDTEVVLPVTFLPSASVSPHAGKYMHDRRRIESDE